MDTITVETIVKAPIEKVWDLWTNPTHIVKWAFASDDWEATSAENDMTTGGKFKTVMAARDKSASFDFSGQYTDVQKPVLIEYNMEDGRQVKITFLETPEGVKINETFDPESENPIEMQKTGWQSILDNFKSYVEKTK